MRKLALAFLVLATAGPALAQTSAFDDPRTAPGSRAAAVGLRVVEAVPVREATALKLDGVEVFSLLKYSK